MIDNDSVFQWEPSFSERGLSVTTRLRVTLPDCAPTVSQSRYSQSCAPCPPRPLELSLRAVLLALSSSPFELFFVSAPFPLLPRLLWLPFRARLSMTATITTWWCQSTRRSRCVRGVWPGQVRLRGRVAPPFGTCRSSPRAHLAPLGGRGAPSSLRLGFQPQLLRRSASRAHGRPQPRSGMTFFGSLLAASTTLCSS